MEEPLFCLNHPEKIAKRHCNKCDQNICNDCVFDYHIDHYQDVNKINYSIDIRPKNFSQMLSKELKDIIEKSLSELKPQICKLILEKTENYIQNNNNNIDSKKAFNDKKELKTSVVNKNKNATNKSGVNASQKVLGKEKNYDDNNPYKKGADKNKGVKDMAKIFDHK